MPPRATGARGSVRLRTTAAATVVVLLTLALGSWALLATLGSALGRTQDDAAYSRADDLLRLAAAGQLPRKLPSVGDDGFVQVVGGDGRVRAATPNVTGRPAVSSLRPPARDRVVRTVRGVPDDKDLENYWVWAESGPSPGGPITVYVATSLEAVSEAVSTLRDLLIVGVPAVAALLALLTWFVLGRALRPVEAIRAEVATISDAELDRRVPEPTGDDEIARLARTMNAMLGRLEQASIRQAAFTSDASHELQSPLTAVRAQLEVALARPRDADWPDVAREVLREAEGMERLVRDLLFLARSDEVAEHPGALVDLDDVVLEEAVRVRATASVPVVTTTVSAAPVRGSRDQLVRLTRNLLENASRHARTSVEISLAVVDGTVRLAICDDGPGVPPEDRDRIFDRFVRLDEARSGSGSGLGLAIVAAIAERHGGTVAVDGSAEGASFVVSFPGA